MSLTSVLALGFGIRCSREFVGPQFYASGASEHLATVLLQLRHANFNPANPVDNAARARRIKGVRCVVPHQLSFT